MSTRLIPFWEGSTIRVFATKKVVKILKQLDGREVKKFRAVLNFIDREGKNKLPANADKCKFLLRYADHPIWELKQNQLRVAFIKKQHSVVLIYAFKKQQNSWPKVHVDSLKTAIDDTDIGGI